MAKPIKSTPILTGKEAERFNQLVEEQLKDKVSPKKKKEMFQLLDEVLRKAEEF